MKCKVLLMSMMLVLTVFLAAAQHNTANEKLNRKAKSFKQAEWMKTDFPVMKKQQMGGHWWEPDTICLFNEKSEPTVRYLYEYDTNVCLLKRFAQVFQDGAWVNAEQYFYTYDGNNNMLTSFRQGWHNNAWVNNVYNTYTYDEYNNMLTYSDQYWNSNNNSWLTSSRKTYTYDESNNMLTFLYEHLRNNIWEIDWRDTYTYDANNNMLLFLQEEWQNNVWVKVYEGKNTYTYDENNNVLTYLCEEWRNGTLDSSSKYTYTYDLNNNQLTELYDRGVFSGTVVYTYDANNNMLTELYKDWENDIQVYGWKGTYTYDENNNLLTQLEEEWQSGVWVNDRQYSWTYDVNDNCTLVEATDNNYLPIYYNNMQSNQGFNSCYKATAIYKEYNKQTAITDVTLSDISVYPNPTQGELIINNEQLIIKGVEIIDMFGKTLNRHCEERSNQFSIDLSPLPAGIYMVRITTGKETVTKRVVKTQ